ncbi:MAG: M13 family metallopeptidase [Porticoccaceae bacterium]|nr:M13 family metallopeptidase [Porticoccaceae bacterium]
MKKTILGATLLLMLGACSDQAPAPLSSGIDRDGMNLQVRPQDDFYEYANGGWLARTKIPADEVGWGSYMTLRKESLEQSNAIVLDVAANPGTDRAKIKIGDYYNAYMDKAGIEALGMAPIAGDLAAIDQLRTHDDVAAYFGSSNPIGVDAPFNLYVGQDDKDATRYAMFFVQSGLGLPDRNYYSDSTDRGVQIIAKYKDYIETALSLTGHQNPSSAAQDIFALESQLAAAQWTKVENRNADKVYNKVSSAELSELLSNLNLEQYLSGIGVTDVDYVIVMQPSYLEAVNNLFRQTPVIVWQDYLRLRLINGFAAYLSSPFVDARFEFYAKTLSGRQEQRDRWRRAVRSINDNLGELLGQLYVEKHFPPESKARMVEMVDYLIAAYADSIKNLDWMSDATKQQALVKLSKFTAKIGYPDTWRDYTDLNVVDDDLVGNIKRARSFSHNRNVGKLGKAIDRGEWFMAPQQVNAYYNPGLNEIVFPAAYLQAPNFLPNADNAYNYGTIGTTIGHEIGHGFDDQGSKYDGDGNLKSWWTAQDRANFDARTKSLVSQFNKFQPLPGLFVNGKLTLGENIGDLGGTAIALKAYRMSLQGKSSPIVDGFTGEERFFIGNAQSSRLKWRNQILELIVKTDPHSPDKYRINGVFSNMADFYKTYQVEEGDGLYLPPAQRVQIWQ